MKDQNQFNGIVLNEDLLKGDKIFDNIRETNILLAKKIERTKFPH